MEPKAKGKGSYLDTTHKVIDTKSIDIIWDSQTNISNKILYTFIIIITNGCLTIF